MFKKFSIAAAFGVAALAAAPAQAGKLILINVDPPGVGFNETTPATPVGGNPGTTVGQQRLFAYQRALTLWGSVLKTKVPVQVQGSFARLTCTAGSGVLAQAGALTISSDFPNAPLAAHWYGAALANAIAGEDLDPDNADIVANFNGAVGQPDCIAGPGFYYGVDNVTPPGAINFLNTFMHEVAHGLGFQNFANEATGALPLDQADVYMAFTRDLVTGLQWDQLTAPQIVSAAIRDGSEVWTGPLVTSNAKRVLGPFEGIRLTGNLTNEITFGTAGFGAPPSTATLNGDIVAAVDGGGVSTLDGCEPITNDVAGKVALINRGTCAFTVKVVNAQNAGASAVLIANNLAGAGPIALGGADPTITITAVGISLEDGNAIRAALPGVGVSYFVDPTRRSGSSAGYVRVYAPTVVALGSSISHFDTVATPNLLMEPAITTTLNAGYTLDLTPSLMRDVGWSYEKAKLGTCNTTLDGALPNGELVLPQFEACDVAARAFPPGRDSQRSFGNCIATLSNRYVAANLISPAKGQQLTSCGTSTAKQYYGAP